MPKDWLAKARLYPALRSLTLTIRGLAHAPEGPLVWLVDVAVAKA